MGVKIGRSHSHPRGVTSRRCSPILSKVFEHSLCSTFDTQFDLKGQFTLFSYSSVLGFGVVFLVYATRNSACERVSILYDELRNKYLYERLKLLLLKVRWTSLAVGCWHGLFRYGVWLVRAESVHHPIQRFWNVGERRHTVIAVHRRRRRLTTVVLVKQSLCQMWICQRRRVPGGSLYHWQSRSTSSLCIYSH